MEYLLLKMTSHSSLNLGFMAIKVDTKLVNYIKTCNKELPILETLKGISSVNFDNFEGDVKMFRPPFDDTEVEEFWSERSTLRSMLLSEKEFDDFTKIVETSGKVVEAYLRLHYYKNTKNVFTWETVTYEHDYSKFGSYSFNASKLVELLTNTF